MNEMLDRLEDASQRQRRFVSDASHELRSPVASIRTQLEVALRPPDRDDWPVVAERVLAEDERLEQAVADLVELARLDEARRAPRLGEVDLDEVVFEERAQRTASRSTRRASRPGGCTAAATQLARVVRNLIDNAAATRESRSRSSLQRPTTPSSSSSPTTGPASRPRTASACSSGSPASTRAAPATPAAWASGSRW